MIKIRKSEERGHADHGWLNARHSFSFADYHDPAHMGYSVLRVINEDEIAADAGFGMHAHCDMEIITYILSGALRHRDSMGNGAIIGVGDVQRMTAGTGVRHSEFNASTDAPVHLLQIWILPEENNLPPSYEDKHFTVAQKHHQWCLIASPEACEGTLMIHQDVRIYASLLSAQSALSKDLEARRCAYLHIAKGDVLLNGIALTAGDAAKIEQEEKVEIKALADAEMLWFDLPLVE
jgi:quercetin 2,3-dioxygenase